MVCLCFPRVVFSAARFQWFFKFQIMPLSLFLFFSFLFFFNILKWRDIKLWNINLFLLLDDVDMKNKEMNTNTGKLQGILKKSTKITEWYDLVSEPSSDTTLCEPCDHVVTQPTTKNEIRSRKAEIRSDRSVTQWKPAPRHQHYWNE